MQITVPSATALWGDYVNYDDVARLEYGRRLWRDQAMRQRLLKHWTDRRHPHCQRFQEQRVVVEQALTEEGKLEELDQRLRQRQSSLRVVVREIPPVFGSFF
jgi:hypothetical protein